MREIKFRGKNKDIGWVCGQLAYDINGNAYIIQEVELDSSYGIEETILFATMWYRVEKETLGQYTGLKDKNGKEIYEGDIIEFSYDMFVGNFDTFVAKGKVVFEEGAFYVEAFENERTTEGEAYLLYSINLDTIEVIGNIYENKELLNETNR